MADLIIDSIPRCKFTAERKQQLHEMVFHLPNENWAFKDAMVYLVETDEYQTVVDGLPEGSDVDTHPNVIHFFKKAVAAAVVAEFEEVMAQRREGGRYRYQWFEEMDFLVVSKTSSSVCPYLFQAAFDESPIRETIRAWAREDFLEIRPDYIRYDDA